MNINRVHQNMRQRPHHNYNNNNIKTEIRREGDVARYRRPICGGAQLSGQFTEGSLRKTPKVADAGNGHRRWIHGVTCGEITCCQTYTHTHCALLSRTNYRLNAVQARLRRDPCTNVAGHAPNQFHWALTKYQFSFCPSMFSIIIFRVIIYFKWKLKTKLNKNLELHYWHQFSII